MEARLLSTNTGANQTTYYATAGRKKLAEYTEVFGSTNPAWRKSYLYLGSTLLATVTPNGSAESFEYHHPDRLGTKLVTNASTGTSFEQATMPFGTPLSSETTGATNKRFTSYDRSAVTGLDYAINRTYDSGQGRFTQVDPIGMRAASLAAPQTLNMYSYCGNDPINRTDPSGLFWGFIKSIGKAIWGAIKKIIYAAVTAAISAATAFVLSRFNSAKFFSTFVKQFVANLGFEAIYGFNTNDN